MKVIIYTANIGGKDFIREPKIDIPKGVHFVYFSDQHFKSKIWQVEKPKIELENNRRTARWHKINSHLLFPDADYTVWIDANCDIDTEITKLLGALKRKEIGSLQHPVRECTYIEALTCKKCNLDDPKLIDVQMENYEALNFPKSYGLYETQLLVRKNTENVRQFNELWWSELERFSQRDQLSVMFALWWIGLDWTYIPREYRKYYEHKVQTTATS